MMKILIFVLCLTMPVFAQTVGSGVTAGSGTTIGLPASTLPTPPPGAYTFPHLQVPSGNPGTWFLCSGSACSGGTDTGSASAAFNITSPTFTGSAMSTTSNGNGFNVLQYRHLDCQSPPTGGTKTVGTLTVTMPTPTYTTSTITINASATDSAYTVTAIQIYLDNVLIFNSAVTGPITPITHTITGLNYTHSIVVNAFNSNGNVAQVGTNITFGPNCPTIGNVLLDEWFYISDTTHMQAAEFDPDLFTGAHQFFPSFQCRLKGTNPGLWYFWDMKTVQWLVTDVGGGTIPTYPCTTATLTTGVWHHLQSYSTFNQSTLQYCYEVLVFDGSTVFDHLHNCYNAGDIVSAPFLNVENQVDNDNSATSNTIYYDNINATYW